MTSSKEIQNPWLLPSSWQWAKIEEVANTTSGGTPRRDRPEFYGGNIPWVKSGELKDGVVHQTEESITEQALAASSAKLFPKGTVCIALYGATVGRLGILGLDAATNQAVCGIFPTKAVLPWFVFRFLQLIRQHLVQLGKGGAQPNISQSIVRQTQVSVAPVNEQLRILEEIDKQFTRLDAAVAALKRIQANLKRYRAAVLKAACEGRLVPTEAELARREGRSYEPASVLLERILAERRSRWEAAQLTKFRAAGKAPKDNKWKLDYKAATQPEKPQPDELPEGWTWATVGQLAALEPNSITDGPFGSNLKTEHYATSGPRVIRLQNIGEGVFVDAKAHISQEHFEKLTKHRVYAGDIVIAGLGERPPRSCVIPSSIGAAIVKADCIRFKPAPQVAVGIFLNLVLNAEPTKARMAEIVHGVGRPRLNLGEIKAIVVPLPPIKEQSRILSEAERRFSIIDEMETAFEADRRRAERLRQGILKRAFEGRLVPQNPKDESASILLERIRAERAGSSRNSPLKQRALRLKENQCEDSSPRRSLS